MPENLREIYCQSDLRPVYYDDFHCLAEHCKLSCCKGWLIGFDKKDYQALKRQEGSPCLNAALKSGVRRLRRERMAEGLYGEFNMDSGVCPFLREDGLCQLQREKGHKVLPHVCRSYPRSELYMLSGYLERSLSPSCEGVLSLLWNLPDGIEFRSDPLPKERYGTFHMSKDSDLPLWFPVIREWCVDLLQNRRFTLPQRIWLMGLGLRELIEGGMDIRRWMEQAAVLQEQVDVSNVLPCGNSELAMYLSSCIHTLMRLQTSSPDLRPLLRHLLESLQLESHSGTKRLTISLAPYQAARERYHERFSGREYFMENLMVAVFFHLRMPDIASKEELWRGYINFCNLYAMYRFMMVMSCREGAPGDWEELFRLVVFTSRSLIHDGPRQNQLQDELFQNDSATLAHMAILLSG